MLEALEQTLVQVSVARLVVAQGCLPLVMRSSRAGSSPSETAPPARPLLVSDQLNPVVVHRLTADRLMPSRRPRINLRHQRGPPRLPQRHPRIDQSLPQAEREPRVVLISLPPERLQQLPVLLVPHPAHRLMLRPMARPQRLLLRLPSQALPRATLSRPSMSRPRSSSYLLNQQVPSSLKARHLPPKRQSQARARLSQRQPP